MLLLCLAGCSLFGGSDDSGGSSGGSSGSADSPGGSSDSGGDGGGEQGTWDSTPKVLTPEAPGTDVLGNSSIGIDISNRNDGYIVVQYAGSESAVQLFVQHEGDEEKRYNIPANQAEVLPLVEGSGSYSVKVLEPVGDMYSPIYEDSFSVELADEFLPYLYPNQYMWFTSSSQAVAKGAELAASANTDVDVVKAVYAFVVENLTYDNAKTAEVQWGYVPDVDETLETKTGICFDYAALMGTMLRSQGIPTKMIFGYAGEVYHAWLDIYTEEDGWIENAVEFSGNDWVRLDPTFASTSGQMEEFVGDGQNYNPTEYN